jgi:hypothetical protein
VEFLHDGARVDSLSITGAALKLAFNGGKGIYEGRVSPDGASIAGTWTYDGRSAPLELRRATAETLWQVPFLYQYHDRDATYLRPSGAEPKIPFTPKLALEYMEQGADAWTSEWKCVACHTNGSYMVVHAAVRRAAKGDARFLRDHAAGRTCGRSF